MCDGEIDAAAHGGSEPAAGHGDAAAHAHGVHGSVEVSVGHDAKAPNGHKEGEVGAAADHVAVEAGGTFLGLFSSLRLFALCLILTRLFRISRLV